ncbi:MAG: hypothetical protein ACRDLB_13105 [Actinomycetota bacterium]
MRRTKWFATALAASLALMGSAYGAGDFSPTMTFELSDTKAGANPGITMHVEQDSADEEELAHVTLGVPKGFDLAADEDIATGTVFGEGEIVIQVGPACRADQGGAIPISQPLTLPASLEELDRTDEQADRGVHSVWFLDITGVTSITLEVTGSKKAGWKLDGDIPANDNTCPPLVFDLTVEPTAGDVPIMTNRKKPGKAVFTGTFTSAESPATVTLKSPIKITK